MKRLELPPLSIRSINEKCFLFMNLLRPTIKLILMLYSENIIWVSCDHTGVVALASPFIISLLMKFYIINHQLP